MQYIHSLSGRSLLQLRHVRQVISSHPGAYFAPLVAHLIGEVCLHFASANPLRRPALIYAPIRAVLAEHQAITGRLRCSVLAVLISGRLP